MRLQAWYILLNGRRIDMVWYEEDCDADHVYKTLVEHDGYPSHITVKKCD